MKFQSPLSTRNRESAILPPGHPGNRVHESDQVPPSTERRRSERITASVPLIVRGIDLLGQPFEERTHTLAFNLHGCRYASKHHLPKNTWVTIELPQSRVRRNVRARVAWLQRPHSIREFFQIAAELESPSNLWGLDSAPASWTTAAASLASESGAGFQPETVGAGAPVRASAPNTLAAFMEELMTHISQGSGESPKAETSSAFVFTPASDSPLLHELRAELERQAVKAVEAASAEASEKIRRAAEEIEHRRTASAEELFRRWKEDFDRAQEAGREEFSAQLSARQEEFLRGLKAQFEEDFSRARGLVAEIDRRSEALTAEHNAAQETLSRIAQARLQWEAAEAARAAKPPEPKEDLSRELTEEWRHRLQAEMRVAQGQWNELLQSSLDSSLERLVEQISQRSQESTRNSERDITARLAELQKPLEELSAQARSEVAAIRSSLEAQVEHGRTSLAEINQTAGRIRESSAQFEAAGQDALNALHRRLEALVDGQSVELARRADDIAAGLAQRVGPTLDLLGREMVERAQAEAESKIAPKAEKIRELANELAAREIQLEESLRLHRERLRQVSENNQREASAQLLATLIEIRNDFEAARKDALTKWNEELEAGSARASHAAAESLNRASESFQQEARARLQVLVEQAVDSAGRSLEEKMAEAAKKFEAQLADQFTAQLAGISERLEGMAGSVAGQARAQMDVAAEAAAASFGKIVEDVSAKEVEKFWVNSRSAMEAQSQELERSSQHLLRSLEVGAEATVGRFHAHMAAELESLIAGGRKSLAEELAATREKEKVELDERQKVWMGGLDQLGLEVATKFQERLETTSDAWVVNSVRRLNEHGQNSIDALTRSADQALRDSFSKVFDGLAETLRQRTINAATMAGFAQPPRDPAEPSAP